MSGILAPQFMVIAGEASGDMLAAELVEALRTQLPQARFFGAGGERMAGTGLALLEDMTRHSVIGLWEALKRYPFFRRLMNRLVDAACERRPDVIVCVDFSGFNRRLARAIRERSRLSSWRPRIVQYVSPQVWASRPGRARSMARDFDLVLCLLPFEKAWYARHAPELRVEFVGHPLVDRHGGVATEEAQGAATKTLLLLPGSRVAELSRHLPPMLDAAGRILAARPGTPVRLVLADASMVAPAQLAIARLPGLGVSIGGLSQELRQAAVAIASTGTVTLECAYFGVPTVAIYRTSWPTYLIARCLIHVDYLAMPNLLADEALFPELIQGAATGERIAQAALHLFDDTARRQALKARLADVVATLGGTGASRRAAKAIAGLLR